MNPYIEYLLMMIGCAAAMPAEEKSALNKWESENLGKEGLATSDWPGWEKYIGRKPIPEPLELKKKTLRFVYLLRNRTNGCIKIGISARPQQREKTLQSEEPNIEMLACAPGDIALERALHTKFLNKRVRGEWFKLDEGELQLAAEILHRGGE